MLASMLLGSNAFSFFFLLLTTGSVFEFYHMVSTDKSLKPNTVLGILCSLVVFGSAVAFFHLGHSTWVFLLPLPLLMLVYLSELYRKSEKPFHNIAYTLMGMVYTVLPFLFFYALAYLDGPYNMHYPLAFLIMLWSNDTGAYLVGRKLGKLKLFERHSPKKTWEGFAGGVLTSALAAYIISLYFVELSPVTWLVVGLIISVFGTLGDLTESMLKRSFNAKDSGKLLPGHGGLLDRFDGLLMAAPLVYLFLYFMA